MLHLHYVPISWKVLGLTSRWTVGNMPKILSKYSQNMNVKNICAKTATIYLEKFKSSSVYLIAMTYKNVSQIVCKLLALQIWRNLQFGSAL